MIRRRNKNTTHLAQLRFHNTGEFKIFILFTLEVDTLGLVTSANRSLGAESCGHLKWDLLPQNFFLSSLWPQFFSPPDVIQHGCPGRSLPSAGIFAPRQVRSQVPVHPC